MDLAPHVKDIITAYKSMAPTPRRERIIQMLQETYLLATSDGLESVLSNKSTQHATVKPKGLKSPTNGSKIIREYTPTSKNYFNSVNKE